MLLPILTYPLLWAGLLLNMDSLFTSLPNAVLGAVWGYYRCGWCFIYSAY